MWGVIFLGNLTSSIDLNPWVKDSDAQRAGKLIDPVLRAEEERKEVRKVLNLFRIHYKSHMNRRKAEKYINIVE